MLFQIAIAACVGVAMEVVFTAALDWPKTHDVKLMGYSYIWMLPIYGMAPIFLHFLYPRVGSLFILWRLSIYVAILLACEYATGWVLRKATGECPWERNYKGTRWAVGDGLMRFDYAPNWAVACFIFESVFRALPH
jgi:hypothetical protein